MSPGVLLKIPQARVTPSVAGTSSAQQARTAGQESVPERAGRPAGVARGAARAEPGAE